MASKITNNTIAGDILIVTELCKQLKFTPQEAKTVLKLTKMGAIATESLLEEAISKVGKLKRTTENGMDFTDQSDAKKCTASAPVNKSEHRSMVICNIHNKKGALRVMGSMIGDNGPKLYYFIIPNSEIGNKKRLKIMFSPNGEPTQGTRDSFSYRCWNEYQVKTFKQLCKKL
jgi:hypothetical protein